MTAWVELEPDFKPVCLASASETLSFSTLCAMVFVEAGLPRVFVAQQARETFEQHMRDHKVETGGLLIGRILTSPLGGLVSLVELAVPSREFDGTGVSLVMGSSVWNEARPFTTNGKGVVGWFHSHPNLGAFFSGTDRRTQRDFFSQPYSLGLVRDPVRNEEKWFAGPDSEMIHQNDVVRLS